MLTNSQQFLLPQAYTLTTEWSLIIIITQTCTSQVPSSTICWYGVEATQKALEPWTEGQSAPSAGLREGIGIEERLATAGRLV